MSHTGKGYDINKTFIIETIDTSFPSFSACSGVYTNVIQSCSGDTQIFLGTGIIYTNGNFSANTVSATTFYGDGSNLTGINTQDTYVTGGTYSAGTAIFTNSTGGTFDVDGFSIGTTFTGGTVNGETIFTNGLSANTFSATTYLGLPLNTHVTGGTYSAGTAVFTNSTGGTFDVDGFSTGPNIFVTGGTYSAGTAIFTNSTGGTFDVSGFSTSINFTGGTVNNPTNFTDGLTANTFSATTYLGLPLDIRVTGGTHTAGTTIFTNNTGGTFSVSGYSTGGTGTTFTGGTINGATIFTNGLTANTFSATTYLGLPLDINVTGGTYSAGTAIFTNSTGGTFDVNGFSVGGGFSGGTVNGETIFTNGLSANTFSATTYLGLPLDVFVIEGEYSSETGIIKFRNNVGDTFSVTGLTTPDVFVTGGTFGSQTLTLSRNDNQDVIITGFTSGSSTFTGGTINGETIFTNGLTANTFSATTYLGLPLDIRVTGGTHTAGTTIFTNNTGGTFSVSGYSTGGTGTSGITSINGDITAAQTLTVGTTGTSPTIASNGLGDHKFHIPLASSSGVTAGLISNIDLVKALGAYNAAFPYIESSYLSPNGCIYNFIDVDNDRLYLPGTATGFLTIIQASTGDLIATVNVGTTIPQIVYKVDSIDEIWLMGSTTLTYRYSLLGVPLSPPTFTFGSLSKHAIEFSPTKVICTTGSSGNAIQFINPSTRVISSSITTTQLGINNACFAMVENTTVGSPHFGLVAVTARNPSEIALIDPVSETVVALGLNPGGLLTLPAYLVHCELYDCYFIANTTPNSILVLSAETATTFGVVKEIRGIINPYGIAIDQSTGLIYVAGGTPSTVILTIIDAQTNKIVRVSAGLRQATTALLAYSIFLDLTNGYAYVTDVGASGANFATTTKFKIS